MPYRMMKTKVLSPRAWHIISVHLTAMMTMVFIKSLAQYLACNNSISDEDFLNYYIIICSK